MPLYLIRFSYTPEAWAKLVKEPEDRRETIGALLEAAGGKLHGLWYAFGDHDGYVLGEAPDNTSAASALLAVAGSGAFRSLSTTVLLGAPRSRVVLLPANLWHADRYAYNNSLFTKLCEQSGKVPSAVT